MENGTRWIRVAMWLRRLDALRCLRDSQDLLIQGNRARDRSRTCRTRGSREPDARICSLLRILDAVKSDDHSVENPLDGR